MKKWLSGLLLMLAMVLCVVPVKAEAAQVPAGYKAVSTPEDLNNIRNNLSGNYFLTQDIDLTEALSKGGSLYSTEGWITIGSSSEKFTGVLDGNGHSITGYKGNGDKRNCLFYTNAGTIRNLTMEGRISTNSTRGSAFSMINEGTIQNCINKVEIVAFDLTYHSIYGGITARNSGRILNCINEGNIHRIYHNGAIDVYFGGIAGESTGTIRGCVNRGDIKASGNQSSSAYAAGIAAKAISGALIEDCYNTGSISAVQSGSNGFSYNYAAGGMVAECGTATIRRCYNIDSVGATQYGSRYLGAMVGYDENLTIYDCYYLGTNQNYAVNGSSHEGVTALSDSQMRRQSSFGGFDFDNVWTMSTGRYQYPVLRPQCSHKLLEMTEAKEETCTEDGNIQYWYCEKCDVYFSDRAFTKQISKADTVIPAAHKVLSWSETQAPTCTEAGEEAGTCLRCLEKQTREVAALGHSIVIDPEVEPTCTEDGLTEGSHCQTCNEVLTEQVIMQAFGHWEWRDAGVDPTCTETGLTEGSHCGTCGEILTEQTVLPALGHSGVTMEEKAPTCTESGLTEGSYCETCETVLIPQTILDALGHSWVTDPAVEPTCTESGLTEGSHCQTCEKIRRQQYERLALGHAPVTDEAVEATCTETGLTEGSHCQRCELVLTEQQVIPALGHQETVDPGRAPTCTETGLTEGASCGRCQILLKEQTQIPALGHKEVPDAKVEPTCTKTGLTAGSHCETCGTVMTAQLTLEATGHQKITDAASEATCTEAGRTAGSHCAVCGQILEAQKTIPALGHSPMAIPGISASCTQAGLTEGSKCSVCGELLREQETLPPSHQMVNNKCQLCGIIGGQCGDDAFWSLENGVLTIRGTGEMYDFLHARSNPWYDYRDQIKNSVIESGITHIGSYSFSWCEKMETTSIPDTVTSIGMGAYMVCSDLEEIVIPDSVTDVGTAAFSECIDLKKVTLPGSIGSIPVSMFMGCKDLESIVIPEGITAIGNGAFMTCEALNQVTLPKSLKTIERRGFWFCMNLTKIQLPEGLETIGSECFSCSGLTGIQLPPSLVTIEEAAFQSTWLETVVIPEKVESIEDYAFAAINLKEIRFLGDVPDIENDAFDNVTADAWYPVENQTWTPAVRKNYGGKLTWMPYEDLGEIVRIYGDTRFETAYKVADAMKEALSIEKFPSIIVTSGMNFADALSGSYLAAQKQAPILLSHPSDTINDGIRDYVEKNLADGGIVYILGGENAVPVYLDDALAALGVQTQRVAGDNRFLTNLEILNASNFSGGEILVCTAMNFADSLSASATGKPILLVLNSWTELSEDYVNYLSRFENLSFTIVGGEAAVSAELEQNLKSYGAVRRVFGSNRFTTSVEVAKQFIPGADTAVLAYAMNFPDGLCGGPLAYAMGAPLILTTDSGADAAISYAAEAGITQGHVLGGPGLISDETAAAIFGR